MSNNFPITNNGVRHDPTRKYGWIGWASALLIAALFSYGLYYGSDTTTAFVAGWKVAQQNCPNPALSDAAMFDAAQVLNDGRRRSYYSPTCTVEWQRQD